MKTKTALITFSITALLMTIILIILEAYFVAVALVVGLLVLGHRELWSLIRKRKLPPIDERVRENTSKSIRNSFIFFGIVSILTILFYVSDDQYIYPQLEYFLGGLLLAVGIVYVISYVFYDRVEANLDRKGSKIFKASALVAGVSLIVFIINAFFGNVIYPKPGFFTFHRILLYVSPFVFALGITGSMIIFIKGLFARS